MTPDEENTPSVPKGNDKPGGGSQVAGEQQGRRIAGDTNNTDIRPKEPVKKQ